MSNEQKLQLAEELREEISKRSENYKRYIKLMREAESEGNDARAKAWRDAAQLEDEVIQAQQARIESVIATLK